MIPHVSRPPKPGVGWFNQVADVVNAHQQSKFNKTADYPSQNPHSLTVYIKNTASTTIGRFRPIAVNTALDLIASEITEGVTLTGGLVPAVAVPNVQYCIAQEAILPQTIGRAVIAGVTHAYVSGNPSSSKRWRANGQGLVPDGGGRAEHVFVQPGTAERLAIVVLDASGSSCVKQSMLHVYTPTGNGTVTVEVVGPTATQSIQLPANNSSAQIYALLSAHPDLTTDLTVEIGGSVNGVGGSGSSQLYKNAAKIVVPDNVSIALLSHNLPVTPGNSMANFAVMAPCCG
jgi:hypothetical protein